MPSVHPEIIDKLSEIQDQIWKAATQAVTEAAGTALTLAHPIAVAAKTADLGAELSGPLVSIQFSFSHMPDSWQLVLVPQDAALEVASAIKSVKVDELDDSVLSEIRTTLEAIVQGICLAVGNVHGEPVAASGLTIRSQDLLLPPNLEVLDEVVRTQAGISGEDWNAAVIWLMDSQTASFVAGIDPDAEEALGGEEGGSSRLSIGEAISGDSSIEFLMDIPLEISVELGRVKMLVKDVVDLGAGSIVEIDKAAGEPVDVLVNGRLVAKGEVVVIEDNFGVRITEILTPQERLSRLAEVA